MLLDQTPQSKEDYTDPQQSYGGEIYNESQREIINNIKKELQTSKAEDIDEALEGIKQ